jgi:mannosyltransferase
MNTGNGGETAVNGTEEEPGGFRDCDLDLGYVSPVRTVRDLSLCSIKSVLSRSRYLQILVVLTLAGFVLRFWHLGYNSLWLDEAITHYFSSRTLYGIWLIFTGGEFNPPLFYWIEHFMLMLGNSEMILRIVPAAAGVLSIPVFYLVGKEFSGRNAGIIAAACAAFSPFLISYAQEARAYTLMVLFLALAMLFFFRGFKSAALTDWALFGVFSALAFWSHFYAFVMVAALVLFMLVAEVPRVRADPARLKMLGAGLCVFIVLCLPLITVTIRLAMLRIATPASWGAQGLDLVVMTFYCLLSYPLSFKFMVLLALLGAGLVQTFILYRNKGFLLVFVTAVTFAVSCALSFKIPMDPRYLIFLSIVFYPCIAMSYRTFLSVWNHRAVVYLLIIALFLINVPAFTDYYSGYSKADWRGFAVDLAGRTVPGDTVVVVPLYIDRPLLYYYSVEQNRVLLRTATTAQDLEEIRASARTRDHTVYFVLMNEFFSSADPGPGSASAWLLKNARPAGTDATARIALFTLP